MDPATFQPGQAAEPSTMVELSLRCENLADRDVLSKSDPVCIMYVAGTNGAWVEMGRTERLEDTLNPAWVKKFDMVYRFEERQKLRFSVYDWDGEGSQLQDHDFLGMVECTLGEIVAKQSRGYRERLAGKGGTMFIHAEEQSGIKEFATMKFSAKKLDDKDLFGKSDPFLVLSRCSGDDEYTVVHRTEVVNNNLSPDWREFRLSVATICNGDYNRDLKVEVYDADDDGSHDLIGTFHTNLRRLSKGNCAENVYDCINEKKKKKKGPKYKNSGSVTLNYISIVKNYSFLDFIQGGTQVNFTVAIDFTGSNGQPSDPQSLHYQDPTGRPNQYVTAIQSVGEIIQDYDSDKMFPALGFGARIPPSGEVSHEFFLTLDPSRPFCAGLEGILSSYYTSLNNVRLYGPTNFSPVINHVAKFAQVYQGDPSNYFILLIITDGIITDFEETKSALVNASSLPMSVIIVGVGNEDFSAMEILDGDNGRLQSHGAFAKRDIVQFVELRKFVQSGHRWNKELLAKSVLAEIPSQVCSWMKSSGFKPKLRT